MTHEAQSGRLSGLPANPSLTETRSTWRLDARGPVAPLWNLLTSMRSAMVVMLAMAILGLVGTLVIQVPPGIAADPAAKADWLAGVRPRYGAWTDVLDRLQLFSVFGSIWFRGLVALLASGLIACMIRRAPRLWHLATQPRVTVGDGFFAHARQHDEIVVRGDAADLTTRVVGVFGRRRHRVLVEDDGAVNFYADRFRWAPFGSLIGHLGIVVILAGAIVGSVLGFRDNTFMIAEGSTAAVPSGEGLSIKLVSFEDAYYADTGAPADYASDLVLYQDGAEVLRHTARVNDPLRYGDFSFYQSFYGAAALISVTDANAAVLYSDGVSLAWATAEDDRRLGTFTIRSEDMAVWIVGTYGGDDPLVKPGQVRVETYRAGTGDPIDQKTIDQGLATEVSGLTFTFGRELQFTGLSVSRDPGAIFVWIGSLLLIGGFTIGFLFPHRRVWGRLVLRSEGVGTLSVAIAGRPGRSVDRSFADLVTDLGAATAGITAT
jgi:cytochrome c biogenesis protein